MAQALTKESSRLSLRISAEEKALLKRAATLSNTDITTFVLQTALPAAESVIAKEERIHLSARDSLRVLEYLENPPEPTDRLLASARRLKGE